MNLSKVEEYTKNQTMDDLATVVERNVRELPGNQQHILRKFIERHSKTALFKGIDKENLNKTIIYRQFFLNELEERYKRGNMQFLTPNLYGYLRKYIKDFAKSYANQYMRLRRLRRLHFMNIHRLDLSGNVVVFNG